MINLRHTLFSLSALACIMGLPTSRTAQARPVAPDYAIEEFANRQRFDARIGGRYLTLDELERYFYRLPLYEADSQCFQRAEMWSKSLHDTYGVPTYKVMMFYTPKFRHWHATRDGDDVRQYKWWFHTAPVVYVVDAAHGINTPTPYVLDRQFADQPMTLDEWSHFFLVTEIHEPATLAKKRLIPEVNAPGPRLTPEQTHCPLMSNFRDYAVPALQDLGPETGTRAEFRHFVQRHANDPFCMMRIYPMYYMQPADLQQMDCTKDDGNYTIGLTGKGGIFSRGIGAKALERLDDGRPKYACNSIELRDFRESDVKWSCKDTGAKCKKD